MNTGKNEVCCDVCNTAEGQDSNGCGVIEARIPSAVDSSIERYRISLCGACCRRVISGLSRERMVNEIFNEEGEAFSREEFGRV